MKRTIVIGTLLLAMTGIAMSAIVDNYIFLPIAYKQPTPTSTQELPPTEDPYPYGVQYLSNSDVYSSGSIMHVVGEVLNNTSDSLYAVEVSVSFFDSNGYVQGTGMAIMTPLNLPEWERGCFEIIMDVPPDWSYYEFEPITYTVGSSSTGLIILDHIGSYDSEYGGYMINGQVRNDGDQISYNVSVGGTLYNAEEMPVGCGYIIVDSLDLNTGEGSYFSMEYPGINRDYIDVTKYRLRVTGDIP